MTLSPYRIFLLAALLTLPFLGIGQQRGPTSTYVHNGLTLNPAYAGSLNLLSVTALHRKQWVNLPGAPSQLIFTVDSPLWQNRIGVGMLVSRDRIGIHDDISIQLSYAYKIRLPVGILSLGLQGAANIRNSNFQKLDLLHQEDVMFNQTMGNTFNFGAGAYFANPRFHAGVSVPYLMENQVLRNPSSGDFPSYSTENRYYLLTAGSIHSLRPNVKLSPAFLIRLEQDNYWQYDLTLNLILDGIAYIGGSYRRSGEVTFMGQIILNENFRLGYAYELTTSSLNYRSSGTHEVLARYRIKLINWKKDPQCPVYF